MNVCIVRSTKAWLGAACCFVGIATTEHAAAQLAGPPTAIPTHSAWREDATPGDASFFNLPSRNDVPRDAQSIASRTRASLLGLAPIEVAPRLISLNPPAEAKQELVPVPAYATPQPSGPTLLAEPLPAPWFSLGPTYAPPPGAKSGSFQQSLGRATYLPRIGADGFGMTSLSHQFTFALPPFIKGSPILFTPTFTTHFTDGPGQAPVPSELRDYELEFRYLKQATPRLGIDLAVAPSYFGDMDNDSGDAWRITGRALAAWNWAETVQVVAGGLYLGRSDFLAMPVGGVIWKPSENRRFDILFPRPRAYARTFCDGELEHWVYVGGEFGGNTWAIDRPGDIPDKMTYADLRLLVGWERKIPHGLNARFELGWVFNRSIEFNSGFPGFDPSDTLMLRGETSF